MILYLLYPSKAGYALFNFYGIYKIGEKKIENFIKDVDHLTKIVDLVAYYKFDSTDEEQIHAMSEGVVTPELSNFLLLNQPKIEAGKKPEFCLGVGEPKLCLNIFEATKIPCLCDHLTVKLLRGVELHFNDLIEFPTPGNSESDEAPPEFVMEERNSSPPLLNYNLLYGGTIEDLKIGNQNGKAATLMDMVTIRYSVTRRKNNKMLLDTTTNGDPFTFRIGTGQAMKALELGICGMFAGGERRVTVPPGMGYETRGGRGTKGVTGPKGARGHWLILNIRLVDVNF